MVSAPQTIGLQKRVCYTPAITWRPVTHFLSRVMLYPQRVLRAGVPGVRGPAP
jgi:hypothetical protein